MSMLPISPGTNPGGPIFGTNPYATQIGMYENTPFKYDVQTMGTPQHLMAQNYDLQRQRALGTVNGGVQSGTQTAMSALMASGGLSAADKQALQAQGQRQQVNLSQGATAPINQMAAQNMYDTQKFNVGQDQQMLDINQTILNQRARDMAVQNEQKAANLYQQRMKEAMLERQMDAARQIATQQAHGG